METFPDEMNAYREQLQKGTIQQAYRGLMEYFMALRIYFKLNYPEYVVSGSLYVGYMDMTYFAFSPKTLKKRGLKVAIVFVHETFRFEVWLAGSNKRVQNEYWKLFKESSWDQYRLVPTTKGADAIIEHVLVANPDFGDLAGLSEQIERETLKFIKAVEKFLAAH